MVSESVAETSSEIGIAESGSVVDSVIVGSESDAETFSSEIETAEFDWNGSSVSLSGELGGGIVSDEGRSGDVTPLVSAVVSIFLFE